MLSAQRVEEIFRDCLFREDENTEGYIPAEGILRNVGFHPGRIDQNHQEIEGMLLELPLGFMESKGGGMSFLAAHNDKNGRQWTGLHLRVEQLFQLGIAIGKVKLLTPREIWDALPSGMPYYVVLGE